MKAVKGVIVSCGDPAVKQILMWIDSTSESHFIIQDLDDTHLVIKADAVQNALYNLEQQLERNMFSTEAIQK